MQVEKENISHCHSRYGSRDGSFGATMFDARTRCEERHSINANGKRNIWKQYGNNTNNNTTRIVLVFQENKRYLFLTNGNHTNVCDCVGLMKQLEARFQWRFYQNKTLILE